MHTAHLCAAGMEVVLRFAAQVALTWGQGYERKRGSGSKAKTFVAISVSNSQSIKAHGTFASKLEHRYTTTSNQARHTG